MNWILYTFLTSWILVAWVLLFVMMLGKKPKRNLEDANDLLRERNEIGLKELARLSSCAVSLERIAASLEILTKEGGES